MSERNKTSVVGRGNATKLNPVIELTLVCLLQVLGDWGFGRQLNQVQNLVSDYLIKNYQADLFKNGTPGRKCYQGFMSRWHSGLSETTATNIASLRAASCTQEIIVRYFVVLKKHIDLAMMKLVSMLTKAMRQELPKEVQSVRE